jgi:hypothetical protein
MSDNNQEKIVEALMRLNQKKAENPFMAYAAAAQTAQSDTLPEFLAVTEEDDYRNSEDIKDARVLRQQAQKGNSVSRTDESFMQTRKEEAINANKLYLNMLAKMLAEDQGGY